MGIFNQEFTLKYTSGSSAATWILLEIHILCCSGTRAAVKWLKAILAKLHRGYCRWTQIVSIYTNSSRLTHDVCAEGNRFHLPTVVVEGQVPGATIQVLDKHRLIEDHSLDAPPFTRRLNNAPLLLPVQALHIVILKEKERVRELRVECTKCSSSKVLGRHV